MEGLSDETPLEQLLPAAEMETQVADIFLHRSDDAWVITPLGGRFELRPPRPDGLPPPGLRGVIWRLDEEVFRLEDGEGVEEAHVSRRLRKVSSGLRRLKGVTGKLEEKLARFQEEKLDLEKKQRRVSKSQEEVGKSQAELEALQQKLREEEKKFQEERKRFEEEMRQSTEDLSKSKRALAAGHCAVLPPHVLFLAAQDEFVRALPELNQSEKAALKAMRSKPEAAFASSCSLFFTGKGTGSDALVGALLASQCMLESQAMSTRSYHCMEQLLGLSQAVARAANVDGRMRLSFAAASCTLWCALHLSDYLSRRWGEANAMDVAEDLLAEQDAGLVNKRTRLLSQTGASLRRALKSLADYWDHRRRFMKCLAKPGGGASEADLRLLFMPRDTTASELAAHVRRLSGVVEDLVVQSSRKRSLDSPQAVKLASKVRLT